MTRTWVVADPHFGHWGVCKFLREDGSKLRPFQSPEEMDNVIVNRWCQLVHPEDRVYVLGDLAMNRKCIPTIGRCTGRKVLVKGNHDLFKIKDYLPFFDDIRACVTSPHQYILSHIPIHPASMGRWKLNIHGHLHSGFVRLENGQPDPRYRCVSVEHTDYAPILLDTILKQEGIHNSLYGATSGTKGF